MASPSNTRIITYATRLFVDKTYGERPYVKHLMDVVENVEKYWEVCGLTPYEFEVAWKAAWLHDAVEDIEDVTFLTIEHLFGRDVSIAVLRLTDQPGRNRTERHHNTYPLTALHKVANFVKLCDRLANVSEGGRLNKMYAREHQFFTDTLYRPEFITIQNQIDQALAKELARL